MKKIVLVICLLLFATGTGKNFLMPGGGQIDFNRKINEFEIKIEKISNSINLDNLNQLTSSKDKIIYISIIIFIFILVCYLVYNLIATTIKIIGVGILIYLIIIYSGILDVLNK